MPKYSWCRKPISSLIMVLTSFAFYAVGVWLVTRGLAVVAEAGRTDVVQQITSGIVVMLAGVIVFAIHGYDLINWITERRRRQHA